MVAQRYMGATRDLNKIDNKVDLGSPLFISGKCIIYLGNGSLIWEMNHFRKMDYVFWGNP